jgi:hypothetical protein
MMAFVKRLPGMSHLRHLTLGGNEFGEAGESSRRSLERRSPPPFGVEASRKAKNFGIIRETAIASYTRSRLLFQPL